MPAYNAERWIGNAIESALAQTWIRKELIVVDDGSVDRTFEVASRYESKSVRVIRQDNAGAASARNAALKMAQGDYVQWLDADDLLAADKISQQMLAAAFHGEPGAVYTGRFAEFFMDPRFAKFNPTELWKDLAPIEYFLVKFTQNAWMHPGAWLVGRRLTELAGPWNDHLNLDDDGEYFARVVARSSNVRYVPEACTYYRRGNTRSLSRARSPRAVRSLLLSLRLCIAHLLALEDSDTTRAASLTMLQTVVDLWPALDFDKPEIETELRTISYPDGRPPTATTNQMEHRAHAHCWSALLLNTASGYCI